VRLRKESRLRGLLLRTEVEVADGRIVERVAMRAEKPTELSLIYHFMHPWVTEMSDFLALGLDGTERKGVFDGDGGMKVAVPVAWSAVYGRGLGKGAVTAIIEAPPGSAWNVRYWDVPERYRKHYLMAFAKATVPAGPEFVYGAVTVPFEAAADTWEATARALGSACHR
ncbi:MAG: hypothetical protein JXR77_03715, partial [Lentisphaeria bacterium]|nr:hypothetical protein [Lentisphaeria bacterium]